MGAQITGPGSFERLLSVQWPVTRDLAKEAVCDTLLASGIFRWFLDVWGFVYPCTLCHPLHHLAMHPCTYVPSTAPSRDAPLYTCATRCATCYATS